MLFGSNLVAIATILKAKFAAKVVFFSELRKFFRRKINFVGYFVGFKVNKSGLLYFGFDSYSSGTRPLRYPR